MEVLSICMCLTQKKKKLPKGGGLPKKYIDFVER